MHRNRYWIVLLFFIAAVTFWYCFDAGYKLVNHLSLTRTVQADDVKWSVEEIGSERYVVKGAYAFYVDGKSQEGVSVLETPVFRSENAVLNQINEFERQKWTVSYSPSSFKHSTLFPNFPVKEIFYALFLCGLLMYFIWLGFYVTRFSRN